MGVIVPSGIYTDKGTTELRKIFLNQSHWRWLFGFENKQGIFNIHRSFKFCPLIVKKGGSTESIRTAFMRHDLQDWEHGERYVMPYAGDQVEQFSPNTFAILELKSGRDLEILEKIYANSILFGDQSDEGWGIKYAREFDMTNDSRLFKPRSWWQKLSYTEDQFGRMVGPDGQIALPLYQGVMIWQYTCTFNDYLTGSNNRAQWIRRDFFEDKLPSSQYLMDQSTARSHPKAHYDFKIGYRAIQNATNQRTLIATMVPLCPCGNSLGILQTKDSLLDLLLLPTLNSFILDAVLRPKMSQNNINWFYLDELPLPSIFSLKSKQTISQLLSLVMRLTGCQIIFAPLWIQISKELQHDAVKRAWSKRATTSQEIIRIRSMLDAIILTNFALEMEDAKWILRECDHRPEKLTNHEFCRSLNQKGFWRVDKGKDPELRHTVLTLAAFHDLTEIIKFHGGDRDKGIETFCNQNDGEGWMLPETLCLADLGLGHDDRAKKPQPVKERMGPRFLPWQLEQSVEESWAECEQHARNILGEDVFKKFMKERKEGSDDTDKKSSVDSLPGDQLSIFPDDPRFRKPRQMKLDLENEK